jgi:hypothetical protein
MTMNCPACGRYGEPDPFTGYDGADICPSCKADEEKAMPNQYEARIAELQSELEAAHAEIELFEEKCRQGFVSQSRYDEAQFEISGTTALP